MKWALRHPTLGLYAKFAPGEDRIERWVKAENREKATLFADEPEAMAAWKAALAREKKEKREGPAQKAGASGAPKALAHAVGMEDIETASFWAVRIVSGGRWIGRDRSGCLIQTENFGQAAIFVDEAEARAVAIGVGFKTALARFGSRLAEVEGDWAEGFASAERARLEEQASGAKAAPKARRKGL